MRRAKGFPFFPAISLVALLAAVPFASGLVPIVRFTSERIDVHVYPSEVVVEGFYYYSNPFPFPVVQGFDLPFPIDADHPEPSLVEVVKLSGDKEGVRLKHLPGKTGFDIYFSGEEEAGVKVLYRQQAKKNEGTYILTTTAPWGTPLEDGVYSIYTHGTVLLSSNYPLSPAEDVLRFHKTDFMPDKDWRFSWRAVDEKKK